MATTLVEPYPKFHLGHGLFVRRDPLYIPEMRRGTPPLPAEAYTLVQKVQDLRKALDITTIDPSELPQNGRPVLHQAISNLQLKIRTRSTPSTPTASLSTIEVILSWLREKIVAIATAIVKVALSIFKKQPPEATIEAILDELKICQAISPAQYETVLQMSKEPERKPALILLTTLLGFSTSELSDLLSKSLDTSPEYAFSLLLECFLIKQFVSLPSLKPIMNEEDQKSLSTISFDGLLSKEHIKSQLRSLRSLSYRATVYSWTEHLPDLFQTQTPPPLIRACAKALKNNDPATFVKELSPYLSELASGPVSNESLYAKELLSFFSSDWTFDTLAIEIRRQKFISHWGDQVTAIKKAGQALLAMKKCSTIAHRELSNAFAILSNEAIHTRYTPQWTSVCSTFRATQEGAIARNIRKIERLVASLGCELGVVDPVAEAQKPAKHVLHLACSCGGGHNGMVQALEKSFDTASRLSHYHFSSDRLDVPKQITRKTDSVYNLFHKFGLDIDTTEVYNFLLRNDLCSVIEFLKWMTGGDPDAATTEKRQSLIRQAILAHDPDFLDMVYAFDGNDIDEVSQQLGLPLLYVATDLDLNDWKRLPTSPFFREAVPSLHHPEIRKTLHIPESQVEEIGLCVGPEFETSLSVQQLDEVRKQYGIAPNTQVVVFSNGGAALQNTIPERIALEYNDRTKPIHFIVICGKNETFKEYLEKNVLPHMSQSLDTPIKMTILGYQGRRQMAELTQLADVIIGKPGGMSTMEFIKSGTRVIFDETSSRLHWERFNADIVVKSGRGVIMSDPDQILSLMKQSLTAPRRSLMQMAQIRASERYVDVVNRLLSAADRTVAEDGWREKRRSWHKMNKQMARIHIG